jgi:kexin
MQHLAVRTAVQIQPDDPDWERTAQGRPFSYKYGFGLLDGYRYVTAAKDWKNVKPQAWLDVPYVQLNNGTMDLDHKMSGGEPVTKAGVTSSVTVSKEMMSGANLESLEHITVRVWIEHSKRGDVEVEIVSPKGIKSILAAPRHSDSAKTGFPGWRFSTIKHWSVLL